MKYHEIKAYARKLRNNPTASEKDAIGKAFLRMWDLKLLGSKTMNYLILRRY